MCLFLFCCLSLFNLFGFLQEVNPCDSICRVKSDFDYCIESDTKRITVFLDARYADINSYIKDNARVFESPSHKERIKNSADLFVTEYKEQVKTIAGSYGLNVKSGIFVINADGKLEAVSFMLSGENENVLSQRKARCMFEQLYNSIVFPSWDDDTVSECITVRLE